MFAERTFYDFSITLYIHMAFQAIVHQICYNILVAFSIEPTRKQFANKLYYRRSRVY